MSRYARCTGDVLPPIRTTPGYTTEVQLAVENPKQCLIGKKWRNVVIGGARAANAATKRIILCRSGHPRTFRTNKRQKRC